MSQVQGYDVFHILQDASYHWQCVIFLGWVGFRHAISGSYIGYCSYRDNYMDVPGQPLLVTAPKQSRSEVFCVEHHPEGGVVLLMYHQKKQALHMVKMHDDKKQLILNAYNKEDSTQWEFITV